MSEMNHDSQREPDCKIAGIITDCRSEEGITVGLIDALITVSRILAQRDLSSFQIKEALADLRSTQELWAMLQDKPTGVAQPSITLKKEEGPNAQDHLVIHHGTEEIGRTLLEIAR